MDFVALGWHSPPASLTAVGGGWCPGVSCMAGIVGTKAGKSSAKIAPGQKGRIWALPPFVDAARRTTLKRELRTAAVWSSSFSLPIGGPPLAGGSVRMRPVKVVGTAPARQAGRRSRQPC